MAKLKTTDSLLKNQPFSERLAKRGMNIEAAYGTVPEGRVKTLPRPVVNL